MHNFIMHFIDHQNQLDRIQNPRICKTIKGSVKLSKDIKRISRLHNNREVRYGIYTKNENVKNSPEKVQDLVCKRCK